MATLGSLPSLRVAVDDGTGQRFQDQNIAAGMTSLRRGFQSGLIGTDIMEKAAEEASLRAQQKNAEADALRQQIGALEQRQALYAPEVGWVEDITDPGSALSWAGGAVGQGAASMIPQIGAAGAVAGAGTLLGLAPNPLAKLVGAGLQRFGAPAAAGLTNYNQLTGEAYQGLREDPTIMANHSAQELYDKSRLVGAGNAVLDSVIPGAIGSKLAGSGLRKGISSMGPAARTLGEMAFEGGTEAAQGYANAKMQDYLNPDQQHNDVMERVNDFAGGAAGAGPMIGAGNYADAAYRRVGSTANRLGTKAGELIDLANQSAPMQKARDRGNELIDLMTNDDGRVTLGSVKQALKDVTSGVIGPKIDKDTETILRGTIPDELKDKIDSPEFADWTLKHLSERHAAVTGHLDDLAAEGDEQAAALFDEINAKTGAEQDAVVAKGAEHILRNADLDEALNDVAGYGKMAGRLAKKAGGVAAKVGKAVLGVAKDFAFGVQKGLDKKNLQTREAYGDEFDAAGKKVRTEQAAAKQQSYERAQLMSSYLEELVKRAAPPQVFRRADVTEALPGYMKDLGAEISDMATNWDRAAPSPIGARADREEALRQREQMRGTGTDSHLPPALADQYLAPDGPNQKRLFADPPEFEADVRFGRNENTFGQQDDRAKRQQLAGPTSILPDPANKRGQQFDGLKLNLSRIVNSLRVLAGDQAPEALAQMRNMVDSKATPMFDFMEAELQAQNGPQGKEHRDQIRAEAAAAILSKLPQGRELALMAEGIHVRSPEGQKALLKMVEQIATGRASHAAYNGLSKLLGQSTLVDMIRVVNPRESTAQEPDQMVDGQDDLLDDTYSVNDDGEFVANELGDYEKNQAEKSVTKGSGPKVYAFFGDRKLRSNKQTINPFAGNTKVSKEAIAAWRDENSQRMLEGADLLPDPRGVPRFFKAGQTNFDGKDSLAHRIAQVEKALKVDQTPERAVEILKEEGNDRAAQLVTELAGKTDAASQKRLQDGLDALFVNRAGGWRVGAQTVHQIMEDMNFQPGRRLAIYRDQLLNDKEPMKARQVNQVLMDMIEMKGGKKNTFRTTPKLRKLVMASMDKYFKSHSAVVGEQLSDRDPMKITETEVLEMARAGDKIIEDARVNGGDAYIDSRNVLTFKSKSLSWHDSKELHIPVGALVYWVKTQKGLGEASDLENRRNSGKSKNQEYLDAVMEGVAALVGSKLVDNMPYKLNAEGQRESFAKGVPESLKLATTTYGGMKFGKRQGKSKPLYSDNKGQFGDAYVFSQAYPGLSADEIKTRMAGLKSAEIPVAEQDAARAKAAAQFKRGWEEALASRSENGLSRLETTPLAVEINSALNAFYRGQIAEAISQNKGDLTKRQITQNTRESLNTALKVLDTARQGKTQGSDLSALPYGLAMMRAVQKVYSKAIDTATTDAQTRYGAKKYQDALRKAYDKAGLKAPKNKGVKFDQERNEDFFTANPLEEIDPVVGMHADRRPSPMTRKEKHELAELTTAEEKSAFMGKMRAKYGAKFALLGATGAEFADRSQPRETTERNIQRRGKLSSGYERNRSGKEVPDALSINAKRPGHSTPLDFFPEQKLGEQPDAFADVLARTKRGGASAYDLKNSEIGIENAHDAALKAEGRSYPIVEALSSKDDERVAEGMAMLESRVRSAERPRGSHKGAVGGAHYGLPAAAALSPSAMADYDLGPAIAKDLMALKTRLEAVFQKEGPQMRTAGMRLLTGNKKLTSAQSVTKPGSTMERAIAQRQEYLNNPPADYTTDQAKEIQSWATKQMERVTAEFKNAASEDRKDKLTDLSIGLKTLLKKADSVLEGDESLKDLEGTPNPKAQAAKAATPQSRRSGAQTGRKLNAMAVDIHRDLDRSGFAATHDSPIRHNGIFNWRAHIGKGEGNAAFGAGTYLSTADGVHRAYKTMFTSRINPGHTIEDLRNERTRLIAHIEPLKYQADIKNWERITYKGVTDDLDEFERTVYGLKGDHTGENGSFFLDGDGKWSTPFAERGDPTFASFSEAHASVFGGALEKLVKEIDYIESQIIEAEKNPQRDAKSPTYEVSVDIRPEQLMDWGVPLSEQSGLVQRLLKDPTIQDAVDQTLELPKGGELSISGKELYRSLVSVLGSQANASNYLQSLGILGHKYAAAGGTNDIHPNYVIYDDSKITTNYVHFNTQADGSNGVPASPEIIAEAKEYFKKVLGKQITAEFEQITGYSGEYVDAENLIKVSTIGAAGVMQTAYHESLHAFFAKFVKGNPRAFEVLRTLAEDPKIVARLEALLDKYPAAKAQLKDGEERLAYIYQFWRAGMLDLPGGKAKGVFQKLLKAFRRVLGMVRDSERAVGLLEAFAEGKMSDPSVAGKVIAAELAKGTWTKAQMAKIDGLVQWVGGKTLASEVILSGSASARARALAREFYTNPGDGKAGGEEGYLNAKSRHFKQYFNRFKNEIISDLSERDIYDLGQHMIKQTELSDIAYQPVRKAVMQTRQLLGRFRQYMVDERGMEIGDLGPKYYPRVWDKSALMSKPGEFFQMLDTHYGHILDEGVAASKGELTRADVGIRIHNAILTAGEIGGKLGPQREDGVLAPFFMSKKIRTLDWLLPEHSAPFQEKDTVKTVSTYFHDGTRAAEYTSRFGENGGLLDGALTEIQNELLEAAEKRMRKGELKDVKARDKWVERQMRDVGDAVAAMEGTIGKDVKPWQRKANGWVVAYQNIRLLPLMLFSSMVDPLALIANGAPMREAYDAYMRGMSNVFREWGNIFRQDPKKELQDKWTVLAEASGIVDAALYNTHVSNEYSSVYMEGKAKKINDMLFKLNGMEAWDRGMRVAATKSAALFVARHKALPDKAHSARWLKELGLAPDDIHLDDDGYLIVDKRELATKLKVSRQEAARMADKMHSALARWVHGSVITPSSAHRPAWSSDPHYSMFFHLKQFTYSFHQTILKKAVHEMNYGNMVPLGTFVWYIPVMIASDITKGLIQGGGELPAYMKGMDAAQWVGRELDRTGVLGVAGLGVDASQDLWSLGGPQAEQIMDAFGSPARNTAINALPLHGVFAQALK